MKVKSNISVIIPVHELGDATIKMLENAVTSVNLQTVKPECVLFVIPDNLPAVDSAVRDISKKILSKDITVKVVKNQGDTDFCSQLNLGANNVTTKYMTFIELDDEYSNIWFKSALEYAKSYNDTGMFIPLIIETTPEGNFISFTNESVWANQFSDELGILDLNSALSYHGFSINGMVIETESYKEIGGLKPKIKLTFAYEFILRALNSGIKIMSVPKFGYKHMNDRDGSLYKSYNETMTPDERKWWLAQAKKEYYFNFDRVISAE